MHRSGRRSGLLLGALAFALAIPPPAAGAETIEEVKQRLVDLEQTMTRQIEALKKLIQEKEAQRQAEHERAVKALEEKQREVVILQGSLKEEQERLREQQKTLLQGGVKSLADLRELFDKEAGSKASNQGPPPLGREIQGNVYTSDNFKVRLGGSLRAHWLWQDTLPGGADQVSQAVLPATPGGHSEPRENFRVSGRRTRFNLAIAGPKTLGGDTSAFFEMDFDRGDRINPNPRLRHGFGRWIFDNALVAGDSIQLTFGQTGSFADLTAETIDANTMLGGLGAVERRNPRGEAIWRVPLDAEKNVRGVLAFGLERPVLAPATLDASIGQANVGAGELGGRPVMSVGTGIETGDLRIAGTFGWQKLAFYARGTWGEFKDRFGIAGCAAGTKGAASDTGAAILPAPVAAANGLTCGDPEKRYTNWAGHGGLDIVGMGLATKGRAGTVRLKLNGVYAQGDAGHLDASFGTRLFLEGTTLGETRAVGGFINPIFYLTDDLSLRWAGGAMFSLDVGDAGRQIVAGDVFPRKENYQSEVSLWWTPGPWTFGIGYNYTNTRFVQFIGPSLTFKDSRRGQNHKIEAITWFSF